MEETLITAKDFDTLDELVSSVVSETRTMITEFGSQNNVDSWEATASGTRSSTGAWVNVEVECSADYGHDVAAVAEVSIVVGASAPSWWDDLCQSVGEPGCGVGTPGECPSVTEDGELCHSLGAVVERISNALKELEKGDLDLKVW